jgi:hypothetical protein
MASIAGIFVLSIYSTLLDCPLQSCQDSSHLSNRFSICLLNHSESTMAGGVPFQGTADVSRVEAPITWKSYMMCAFAAFGGIFFGFDSGYISGVLAMDYFIHLFTGLPIPGPDATTAVKNAFVIPTPHKSLIVSILSAGTFFGAILAGDLADWFGRRTTVILGCIVYGIGCILQTASTSLGLLVAGRLIAGFGVGFVSAIIILYMSEIAPKGVRGAIVSGKFPSHLSQTRLTISRIPICHHNRSPFGIMRRLRHREQNGHRILPYPHGSSAPLGIDPRRWSPLAP